MRRPAAASPCDLRRHGGGRRTWTLVPQPVARRSSATHLLFDHVGIPTLDAPAVPEGRERGDRLSERVAFFWMLLVPAAKALARGDAVRLQLLLEMVAQTRLDVEALLNGALPGYRRDAVTRLLVSDAERLQAIHAEAQQMLSLHARVTAAGGTVPSDPWAPLAHLLHVATSSTPPAG